MKYIYSKKKKREGNFDVKLSKEMKLKLVLLEFLSCYDICLYRGIFVFVFNKVSIWM